MKNHQLTIGSSIICMDHINFERDVKLAEKIGVDYLHIDVMDGVLVPRYGVYPEIVRRIADICEMKMDVHLMVESIDLALDEFGTVPNVEYVSFHLGENENNALRIIDKIRGIGKKAGVVLNLSTDVRKLLPLLCFDELDSVMLMGIHPGVLKQQSRPELVVEKLQEIAPLIEGKRCAEFIQVDGGVTFETVPHLVKAGATNMICGSSTLYRGVSLSDDWAQISTKVSENYNAVRTALDG